MKTMQITHTVAVCLFLMAMAPTHAQQTDTEPKLTQHNFKDSLQPQGFVMHDPEWYLWGASPVWGDDGKLHVYVSRWPKKHGFKGWRDVSEIAHYVADTPKGPFKYVDTPLKPTKRVGHWRGYCLHSATVSRIDGKWVMTFMGAAKHEGDQTILPKNQANGLALADSPNGPWTLAGDDGLVQAPPTDPSYWCYEAYNGVNNPTLIKAPDGRYLYYFKSSYKDQPVMGVAVSRNLEGPYEMHSEPIIVRKENLFVEDGNVFMLNGKICMLVTDCAKGKDRRKHKGKGGGLIYHSKDGIHFDPEPVRAYENIRHYLKPWPNPIHGWGPWVLQVPRVLLGRDGIPTHLYAPCGTAPEGESTTGIFMFTIDPAPKLMRVTYCIWEKIANGELHPDAIKSTDVLIFFKADVSNVDGSISISDEAIKQLPKLKAVMNPDAEVWMGVRTDTMINLKGDTAKIKKFIHSVGVLRDTHGFKGLDIDWEGEETRVEEYVKVVNLVSKGLRSKKFGISTSHGLADHYQEKCAGVIKNINWVNIQSYWSYHNSYSVAELKGKLNEYERRDIPKSKICVGLPIYGMIKMSKGNKETAKHKWRSWAELVEKGGRP